MEQYIVYILYSYEIRIIDCVNAVQLLYGRIHVQFLIGNAELFIVYNIDRVGGDEPCVMSTWLPDCNSNFEPKIYPSSPKLGM